MWHSSQENLHFKNYGSEISDLSNIIKLIHVTLASFLSTRLLILDCEYTSPKDLIKIKMLI